MVSQNATNTVPQIQQLTNEMTKRAERAKVQEVRYKEMPDIVVKVVCKYRAEMFFKISRKARLSRLFNSWKDRMDNITQNPAGGKKAVNGDQSKSSAVKQGALNNNICLPMDSLSLTM